MRERMFGILEANLNITPCASVHRNNVFSFLVHTIPRASKMERVMCLHLKPFHIFTVLGVASEYAISSNTFFIEVYEESFVFDGSFWVILKRQIWNNCVLFCDEKFVDHARRKYRNLKASFQISLAIED